MTQNLLKLHDCKTDIIDLSSSYNAKSLKSPGLQIGESCITPTDSVKDLRISFNKFLDINDQVTKGGHAA